MSEEQAKYDGGPAFPHPAGWRRNPAIHDGMSLRDWLAGQALLAAWQGFDKGYYEGDNADIAACAYQIADAMLAARDKKGAQ